MKIFLVDVHNAIEMSHYETFFYKNIKQGNISVYEKPLDSLEGLDSVLTWITEEINRNPFSINQALVIFFLPRRLSAHRIPQDFEIYSQMYIHELLKQHLDGRFKYLCFYLDVTGMDRDDDALYGEIDAVNADFSSDDPLLNDSFLPRTLPDGDAKKTTKKLIDGLQNRVTAAFYAGVFALLEKTKMKGDDGQVEDWYKNMFLRTCSEQVADIKFFRGAFYSDDIEQKIQIVLKIIGYICNFADSLDPDKDFDMQIETFADRKKFEEYDFDLDKCRKVIATYKSRLSKCKPTNPKSDKKPSSEPFSYDGGDHSKEFEEQVKKVSTDDLRAALDPSNDELADYDLQERVFASLDRLIQNLDKELRTFCGKRVEEMRQFYTACAPTLTERADNMDLSDEEQEKECQLAGQMNKYTTTELPGYPAELKLRQELELRGRTIRRIGRYLRAMKPVTFILVLLFGIISIGAYYYGLQNSVFAKEDTWSVFGIYLAVFAVLFALSYVILRAGFKRKIRRMLNESMDLVMKHLQSYTNRAKEFEQNLNSAVKYYCAVDGDNKKTQARAEQTDLNKRMEWHRLKINKILDNLSYFDAFVGGTPSEKEEHAPKLDLFEDDAAHSDFYQMVIF